jgi:hypothetical protein
MRQSGVAVWVICEIPIEKNKKTAGIAGPPFCDFTGAPSLGVTPATRRKPFAVSHLSAACQTV